MKFSIFFLAFILIYSSCSKKHEHNPDNGNDQNDTANTDTVTVDTITGPRRMIGCYVGEFYSFDSCGYYETKVEKTYIDTLFIVSCNNDSGFIVPSYLACASDYCRVFDTGYYYEFQRSPCYGFMKYDPISDSLIIQARYFVSVGCGPGHGHTGPRIQKTDFKGKKSYKVRRK